MADGLDSGVNVVAANVGMNIESFIANAEKMMTYLEEINLKLKEVSMITIAPMVNSGLMDAALAQRIAGEELTDAQIVALREATNSEIAGLNSQRIINEEETIARINLIEQEGQLMQARILTEGMRQQRMIQTESLASTEAETASSMNRVGQTMMSHAGWILSAAAFMETISIFKQGILDIDTGMKGLQQTLESTYAEMGKPMDTAALNDISNQFMQVAKDYGVSMKDLLEGAKLVSRQYKQIGEVMAFTRAGTILQVIDNMSLVDSFKALESITNQYGMVAKDTAQAELYSMSITDKISNVVHNAAISAQDLTDGLQRSGSILNEMGVDLDHSIGLITAGVRATQLSGSQIGIALKSVAGSIKSATGVKELEKLGIAVKDSEGNFRSLTAILEDLMIKSAGTGKSLDEVYKAISGGKFQFSKVMSTMSDYGTYVESVALSIASAGASHNYLAAQMDSVVKHAQLLQEQLVGLVNSAGQGGLTTVIKGLIDGLTDIIKWINSLSEANVIMVGGLGTLIVVGLRWTSVVGTIKNVTLAWAAAQEVLNTVTGNWALVAVGLIGALMTYSYVTQQATDADNAKAEAAKNVTDQEQKRLTALKDNFDFSKQQLENDVKQSQFLDDMAQKHTQLTEALSKTSKGTKEYQQLSDDLAATEKATTTVLDAEGKKRLELAGFSDKAYGIEKQALSDKVTKDKEKYEASLKDAKEYTQKQVDLTMDRITALKQESEVQQIANSAEAAKLNEKANVVFDGADTLWKQSYNDNSSLGAGYRARAQSLFKDAEDMFKQADKLGSDSNAKAIDDQYQKLKGLRSDIDSLNSQIGADKVGWSPNKAPLSTDPAKQPKESVSDQLSVEESLIRSYNTDVKITEQKNKIIQKQIDLAKSQNNYNDELKYTSELMEGQTTQMTQLGQAKTKIEQEFANQSSKSGFQDTSTWFDSQGEATVSFVEKYNAASVETKKTMKDTFDTLQKLQKAWYDNSSAIDTLGQSIVTLGQSFTDIKSQIADNTVNDIKSALTMEKDLVLKTIDAEGTALDKAHQTRLTQLDQEETAIESVINAQLKSLDATKAADDYAKSLAKSQSDAQDVQDQINALSLDNSIEAKAKRETLAKQLADMQDQIAQTQSSHSVDLQKQSLQDQLDNDKAINDANKKAEDDGYDYSKSILDQKKVDQTNYFNTQINNEKNFTQMRLDIINGNITNVENAIKTSIDNITKYNNESLKTIGMDSSSLLNVTDKLSTDQSGLASIAKTTVYYANSVDEQNAQSVLGTAKFNYVQSANPVVNANDLVVGGPAVIHPSGNVNSGNWLYGNDASDTENAIQSWRNSHPDRFMLGGETESTGLHMLDGKLGKPERILSAEQTSSFNQLVRDLPSITSILSDTMNRFRMPDLSALNTASISSSSSSPTYNLQMYIENMNGTKSDGDMVFGRIVRGLKKMGVK